MTVTSPTTLRVHATVSHGDPLDAAPAGQRVGLVVMEFAARRRVRINGTLTCVDDHGLTLEVEQAYGNCLQYIQQRTFAPIINTRQEPEQPRSDAALSDEDVTQISAADTFFLGTMHPDRGNDASHRGGQAGFVRVERNEVWVAGLCRQQQHVQQLREPHDTSPIRPDFEQAIRNGKP